jgi:hypothetical protein
MRIVGNQNRSDLETDPARAVQRALAWQPFDKQALRKLQSQL